MCRDGCNEAQIADQPYIYLGAHCRCYTPCLQSHNSGTYHRLCPEKAFLLLDLLADNIDHTLSMEMVIDHCCSTFLSPVIRLTMIREPVLILCVNIVQIVLSAL